MTRAPVLLISRGAATLSVQDPTDRALRAGAGFLASARAVLMISAHDVRPRVTVGGAERVVMWADHPAARGLSWEAPGDLRLAEHVLHTLHAAGIDAQAGAPRLDHGAWVPLRALDPDGQRPVVTVSLAAQLDPARHLDLGRALAPLRDQGVAIVGLAGPSVMPTSRTDTHSALLARSALSMRSLSSISGRSQRRKTGRSRRLNHHGPLPPAPRLDMQTMRGTLASSIATKAAFTPSEIRVVGFPSPLPPTPRQ